MSVVIRLEKGKVESIIVEDLQEACSETAKVEPILKANFGNSTENAAKLCPADACANNEDGACDFKLFVSWIGTDKNNNNLVSSGERFMNFKNYNLSSLYDSFMKVSNRENTASTDAYDAKSVSTDVLNRVANPPIATLTA